jgi:hypothetical protein
VLLLLLPLLLPAQPPAEAAPALPVEPAGGGEACRGGRGLGRGNTVAYWAPQRMKISWNQTDVWTREQKHVRSMWTASAPVCLSTLFPAHPFLPTPRLKREPASLAQALFQADTDSSPCWLQCAQHALSRSWTGQQALLLVLLLWEWQLLLQHLLGWCWPCRVLCCGAAPHHHLRPADQAAGGCQLECCC